MVAAWYPPLETAAAVLFWLMLAVALIWLRRHIDVGRGRREPVLREDEPGAAGAALPAVTVLVAAKDEQDNIERCVRGLLAQDYPRFEVIAIDDRSSDATGEILDRIAREDARLTVLHVETLPPGWFGKNHAMHRGVQQARCDWFVFTDADCTFDSPHLLRAAVRLALREGIEFLSVLPRLEALSFWEKVVQPVAGGIMVFWFPPPKVNDPTSPVGYANGAFMLMRREAYERIGGHAAVPAVLNEDIHFARRAKQAGVKLRVIRGGDLYRVRMYVGLRQVWRGWSRIFYGCLQTPVRLCASVGMLAVFSVGPWLVLAGSLLTGFGGAYVPTAAGAAIAAQQSVLWRFYGLTGNRPVWALSYPLGALMCLLMTLDSMRRFFGAKTTWRGTAYQGGAGSEPPAPAHDVAPAEADHEPLRRASS